MKSIFKILVLGAVPILAVTMVANQGLAADKGSQLIFQSNMAHKSFISVANANNGRAVTVLVQYYNDEMSMVLYYLRVIPGGGNFLVDPFNHEIPGTAEKDDDGMEIEGTATNVSDVLGTLPEMTNADDGAGVNSGRFAIVVTAVGANVGVDANGDGTIADVVSRETAGAFVAGTPRAPLADTVAVSVGGYYIHDGAAVLIRREATSNADGEITEIVLRDPRAATADPQPADLFGTSVETNRSAMVNVLFPSYLAAGMHGVDNIDNGGKFRLLGGNNLGFTKSNASPTSPEDTTSKNVGDLNVNNAIPIAFNHLTGHFTEALTSAASGGTDQTASWGGTPIVRPAVSNTANGMMSARQIMGTALDSAANQETDDVVSMVGDDYHALTGMNSVVHYAVSARGDEPDVGVADADVSVTITSANTTSIIVSDLRVGDNPDGADADGTEIDALTADTLAALTHSNGAVRGLFGGRLAEKDAGGGEVANAVTKGSGMNRGLMGGALVLPALHGGGAETKQIMLFLSAADHFGGAGGYKLMAAKTKYTVTVHDNMGDVLADPADDRVFGGSGAPELAGVGIIVEGISVMTDAGDCGGDMIDGPWTLDHLTGIVPTASSGSGKFAGLDAMLDPAKNATPGFIKFMRGGLTCKKDFGDGNNDDGNTTPAKDERTYEGGTLIVEKASTDRAFVTTGQALLKFLTANSTFAASWSLKSPASPAN